MCPQVVFASCCFYLARRAKQWNSRTPRHVTKYRVEKSNKYHNGSKSNFMQKYEHAAEVEAKFAQWMDSQKFSSRTLPTSGILASCVLYFLRMVVLVFCSCFLFVCHPSIHTGPNTYEGICFGSFCSGGLDL